MLGVVPSARRGRGWPPAPTSLISRRCTAGAIKSKKSRHERFDQQFQVALLAWWKNEVRFDVAFPARRSHLHPDCSLRSVAPAAVPTADFTLEPVVTNNLPLITSLTAYVYESDRDAVSTTLGSTNILYEAPIYYPFDTDTTAWWDNLVAEQLQARLPVVMFASRGAKTTNSTQIDGGMNPVESNNSSLGLSDSTSQLGTDRLSP